MAVPATHRKYGEPTALGWAHSDEQASPRDCTSEETKPLLLLSQWPFALSSNRTLNIIGPIRIQTMPILFSSLFDTRSNKIHTWQLTDKLSNFFSSTGITYVVVILLLLQLVK